MANVDDALAWAARGFRVFPIVPMTKVPAIGDFSIHATVEPHLIRAWWVNPLGADMDYNIGVSTEDLVLVDVDVKEGRPGVQSFQELGGSFDTLVVHTPTGGYHCYYNGPTSRQIIGLKPGVDIKGAGGYVLGPGSYVLDPDKGIDGSYTVADDKEIAWVPLGIEQHLKPPGVRRERTAGVELDATNAIRFATTWLAEGAPIAVEDGTGDITTYNVACTLVRDYALSLETSFSLMLSYWNDRCQPPWEPDDLWRKVDNADSYAKGATGSKLPEAQFGPAGFVEPPPPPPLAIPAALRFGNIPDLVDVPLRPWVIPRLLMTGAITVLAAAGGAGKSVIALTLAAHMACGRNIANYKIDRPMKSIMYNAEDDRFEQARRLGAICEKYKLDFEKCRRNIMSIGRDDLDIDIARSMRGTIVANESQIKLLVEMARDEDVHMLCLDPLVEIHGCEENNNTDMKHVMALIRGIARYGNVPILLPHHTSRQAGNAAYGKSNAGNQDVSRGASSIVNAARIALTLFAPTDEDREKYQLGSVNSYVRLDDAKANLHAKGDANWFMWETVRLTKGDQVGVLTAADMRDRSQFVRNSMGMLIYELMMTQANSAAISLASCVAHVKAVEPMLWGRKHDNTVREAIQRALTPALLINGVTLVFDRERKGGKDNLMVKML